MQYDPRRVLLHALTTEKSLNLRERGNCVAFRVALDADKLQVQRAVEEMFNVKVTSVRTMVVRGKKKRLGRFEGRRPFWKKALVTLRKEDHIELFEKV
ncbi:MAG: 50S ribosomal protein L23 [candidate division Zixibacteria bacterium]|nr:50S ribosomal protein L23 [candidate division Zixibacteria bacterium]